MPQFTRHSTRPMQPESYRAAARKLRRLSDQIEVRAASDTPQERRALTRSIHSLGHFVRALVARHNGRLPPDEKAG